MCNIYNMFVCVSSEGLAIVVPLWSLHGSKQLRSSLKRQMTASPAKAKFQERQAHYMVPSKSFAVRHMVQTVRWERPEKHLSRQGLDFFSILYLHYIRFYIQPSFNTPLEPPSSWLPGCRGSVRSNIHTHSDFHREFTCLRGRQPLLKDIFLAIYFGKRPSLKHCIQTELQVFLRKKSLPLK